MNKNLYKKIRYLATAGALSISLAGCGEEVSTNVNASYDMIDTTNEESLKNGVTQTLEVPGENFQLVVDYQCDLEENEKWTVTSDKQLHMEIRTDGVTDEKVYIDNIHTDTSICSYYAQIDGVMQDTMDDRIHNSLMLGFSISDTNSYRGINQIEGQNDTFVKGFASGYNGFHSASITEQRFLESDFLKNEVYANKISSVIDLIIVNGEETTFTSVQSEVQVSVWPYIQFQDDDQIIYRFYYLGEDGKMTYDELTPEEYYLQTQEDSSLKLTR